MLGTATRSSCTAAFLSEFIDEGREFEYDKQEKICQGMKKEMKKSISTLKRLLQTALAPVGSTMYVWGGGWNRQDTGAGKTAVSIGVPLQWKEFFLQQTADYDYRRYRYLTEKGLDCSGYIGWCIYNILNTENGREGYVRKAREMAKHFADRGWGSYREKELVRDYRAGDIMSGQGHVWMAVGECADGSVVLLHSSPPGVQLCGTVAREGTESGIEELRGERTLSQGNGMFHSQASRLAQYYMRTCYPQWYQKYGGCIKGIDYLTDYGQMRWDVSGNSVMTDPEGYENMTAEQILEDLMV